MATEVYNIMEELVMHDLQSIVDKYPQMCRCDQCIADITAMALNNLKPKYVSSNRGGVMARVMSTTDVERINLIREITNAVEKVSSKPHHTAGIEPVVGINRIIIGKYEVGKN